jgi:hypothetical protein
MQENSNGGQPSWRHSAVAVWLTPCRMFRTSSN